MFGHADDCVAACRRRGYDLVCMDFTLGPGRRDSATATAELRASGYHGKILGISSDPAANAQIRAAGADAALGSKAQLRSYLVHVGAGYLRSIVTTTGR